MSSADRRHMTIITRSSTSLTYADDMNVRYFPSHLPPPRTPTPATKLPSQTSAMDLTITITINPYHWRYGSSDFNNLSLTPNFSPNHKP